MDLHAPPPVEPRPVESLPPPATALGQRRSLPPLLAITVVIALPNVLSTGLHMTPVLSLLLGESGQQAALLGQRLISALLILVGVSIWWSGSRRAIRFVIVFYAGLATVVLCGAVVTLVLTLPNFGPNQAPMLIKDALIVWSMNILSFSLWYWLIDSGWLESMGGADSLRPDFLFAQQSNAVPGWEGWTPRFLEYLHLAYNTSTAFSPTDVTPLSHRAKLLMLIQSSISLVVVAAVLSRAINILAAN